MKKLILFFALFFTCMTASFADTSTSNAPSRLNLSSDMLGLNGPLSFSTEYSEQLGAIFNGQYTQSLGENNAYSLLLNAGKNQYRGNLGFAHAFSQQQRIKFSYDYLTQNTDFDFASGDSRQWDAQQAFGGEYQYLIKNSFFKDIDVSAYYARANSKNLNTIALNDDEIDLRRLAGGTDKNFSIGTDIAPFSSTLLGIKLNYDNLSYDTEYNSSNSQSNGFGVSVTAQQLLSQQVKLNLLASDTIVNNEYDAGLSYAVNSNLDLDAKLTRLIGHHGLQDDTQYQLGATWRFGAKHDAQETLDNVPDSLGSLTNWAIHPAVEMPQVLVIKDEKIMTVAQNNGAHPAALKAALSQSITVNTAPDLPIKYNISQPGLGSNQDLHYSVSNLPPELTFDPKTNQISGQFSKNDIHKNYPVTINITQDNQIIKTTLLTFMVSSSALPYPNPTFQDQSMSAQQNRTFSKTYTLPTSRGGADAMFVNPAAGITPLKAVQVTGLDPASGISYQYVQANQTLTFSGTAQTPGVYHINVQVENGYEDEHGNKWSAPQALTLAIQAGQAPSFNNFPTNVQMDQNHPYSLTGDIQPGSGTVSSSSVKVTLNGEELPTDGLSYTYNSASNSLQITGTPTGAYAGSTDIPFVVTATNSDNLSASYTMHVNYRGLPKKLSDPQDMNVTAGQALPNAVPVNQAFSSYANSGAVHFANMQVTDPAGHATSLANLGLNDNNDQIQGTVPSSATPGNYNITFQAANDVGTSTASAHFALQVQAAKQAPSFTSFPTQTVPMDQGHAYAPLLNGTITPGSGTVSQSSIQITLNGQDISADGLSYTYTSSTNSLQISGTPTGAYAGNPEVPLVITATNSDNLSASYTMHINYRGLPKKLSDPQDTNVTAGQALPNAVPVNQAFSSYANSGAVHFNNVQVTDPAGHAISLANLGLNDNNDQIQGTVLSSATPGNYNITFQASNDVGISTASAHFVLQVQAAKQAPSFTGFPTKIVPMDQGHAYAPLLNGTITPGSGTLSSSSIQVTLNGKDISTDGLSYAYTSDTNSLEITGTPNGTNTGNADLPLVITATNSDNLLASYTMHINYRGLPKKLADPQDMNVTAGQVLPNTVPVSTYFSSYANSGAVHFENVQVTDPSGHATSLANLGLNDSNDQIQGTVNTSASAGDYYIAFQAVNDVGTSKDTAQFTLHIDKAPTVTLTCPSAADVQNGAISGGQIQASSTTNTGKNYQFSGNYTFNQPSNVKFQLTEVVSGNQVQCRYSSSNGPINIYHSDMPTNMTLSSGSSMCFGTDSSQCVYSWKE